MSEIAFNEAALKNISEPIIEFKGVSKTYQTGTHALSDINIRINRGEFVFIVGESGAGKSTFMKLIMREEKPNTGTIKVNGFNLTKMRSRDVPKLRRTMGIVFQDFRLINTMNVFDNVAFAMHIVEASKSEIRQEVSKALAAVGLGGKARSMPLQLSGGEQQRVGLARALVNAPDIIIADEPTGNVDAQRAYDIVSMLTEINKRGTTVLMVTHDNNLVYEFRHRRIILSGGHITSDSDESEGII